MLTVILFFPALAALSSVLSTTTYIEQESTGSYDVGVLVLGEAVSSLYVNDGQGQRVDGARVFTDQGTQVVIDPWTITGEDGSPQQQDTFPITAGVFDGWNGSTDVSSTWTPPVLIRPAPGFEAPAPEVTTPEQTRPEPTTTESEPSVGVDGPPAADSAPTGTP